MKQQGSRTIETQVRNLTIGLLALAAQGVPQVSWANTGVFNIPKFVEPGNFAIGLEPVLTLGNRAGLGGNVRYTHGLNDLMNVQGIIGHSGGDRQFRVGGNMTFDFFPDIDKQPGIGISTQAVYYRLSNDGQLDLTAIPYVHKAFALANGNEVEPFVAVPFGMAFSSGRYKALSSVSVGAMFKNTEKLRYVLELGVAVNNTDSYISGGLVYYH